MKYDIAIIGAGPAGISAALTAKQRNKTILLLGDGGISPKITKATEINNYPGFPAISGDDLAKALSEHLNQQNIEITPDRVNAVYNMGKYFAIQGHKGNYEASTVILATGVSPARYLPGEQDFLGRGVSYCATCDAMFYKGKSAIIVAEASEDEEEALFLAEVAQRVIYIPLYEGDYSKVRSKDNLEIISDSIPKEITKAEDGMHLKLDSSELTAHGIFLLKRQLPADQLVPGLKVTASEVITDRQLQTNIKGLFVCGDAAGAPYQYIKAAGEGNVAALSAVKYLTSPL